MAIIWGDAGGIGHRYHADAEENRHEGESDDGAERALTASHQEGHDDSDGSYHEGGQRGALEDAHVVGLHRCSRQLVNKRAIATP
ncbi:hypothetical protein [Nonomuraea recticatena]|uniref:hypothetical protein n=1 Tax=Nonomuraea recticatena TaxID=46178 RepID=UPI00361728FE